MKCIPCPENCKARQAGSLLFTSSRALMHTNIAAVEPAVQEDSLYSRCPNMAIKPEEPGEAQHQVWGERGCLYKLEALYKVRHHCENVLTACSSSIWEFPLSTVLPYFPDRGGIFSFKTPYTSSPAAIMATDINQLCWDHAIQVRIHRSCGDCH